jgi:hypothetical protein
MNAKKCKALRRAAEKKTVGKPYGAYRWQNKETRKTVLLTNCTRYVYQRVKRAIKSEAADR